MKKYFAVIILTLCLFTIFADGSNETISTNQSYVTNISQEDWANSKKFVELSTGIKMAYVEMGNPDGEVVILQHGMTDNSRSWSLAAPYFAKAGYHVYLPDLRGQGLTETADGFFTTLTYATDLEAFFDAMNIDKAILIGHSLGSFTVQSFLLMFPERCSKVVLVSSIPLCGIQNTALYYAYQKYIEPLKGDEHPSDAFMDNWYACEMKESKYFDVFDTFLSNLKKEAQVLPKQSWKNIMYGLISTNIYDLYPTIDHSIPVLLLHGNDDTMTATEYQEQLIELLNIPKTSYRNYMNIGHNIQFEIPEQSSNDILTWLKTGSLN